MSSIAYTFARKRVLAINEALEQWQVDHAEANFACDVEELVIETTDVVNGVKRLANNYEHGIRRETTTEEIVCAHRIGNLLDKALEVMPKVINLGNDIKRRGYPVSGLSDLLILNSELAKTKAEIRDKWMLPDKQKMAKARQDHREGRFAVL